MQFRCFGAISNHRILLQPRIAAIVILRFGHLSPKVPLDTLWLLIGSLRTFAHAIWRAKGEQQQSWGRAASGGSRRRGIEWCGRLGRTWRRGEERMGIAERQKDKGQMHRGTLLLTSSQRISEAYRQVEDNRLSLLNHGQ